MKTTILTVIILTLALNSYSKDYSSIKGKKWKTNEMYINEMLVSDTAATKICYNFVDESKFTFSNDKLSVDLTYTLDSSTGNFVILQNGNVKFMEGSIQYFDDNNLVFFYKSYDSVQNLYHTIEVRLIKISN